MEARMGWAWPQSVEGDIIVRVYEGRWGSQNNFGAVVIFAIKLKFIEKYAV